MFNPRESRGGVLEPFREPKELTVKQTVNSLLML